MTWGDPTLSAVIACAYLGLLSLLWLLMWIGVPLWGRAFRLMAPAADTAGSPGTSAMAASLDPRAPLLSVCIPARNEVHNIEACVKAARALRGVRAEVIVVDDKSDDGTGDAARAAAEGDERVRVIRGTEPSQGWAGKPWACARAAGEASGDLLLFIDADVVLHPDAARALVGELISRRLALLSVYGTWTLVGFWERVVVPAVGWLIRGAIDLARVNDPGRPEAFANGQCILVDRRAYDSLDGHGVVRDQVLDDVRLAQAFKQRGHAIGLLVAPWAFSVRLYRSLAEIVAGYSKNLYEGMGRQPILGLGSVLFILVGALTPFLLLLGGLVARLCLSWSMPGWVWLAWIAAICLLQLAFRWRIERRDGRSGALAWSHPLANLVLAYILLRAVFGVRSSWKGRSFIDGRASPG